MRVHTQEFSTPCPLLDPLFEKFADICKHSFAFLFVGFLWKEPLETEPSSIYCLSSLFFAQSSRLSFHVNCEGFSSDDYIDNMSSSMLERLCSKLWPHLCRRPCVSWVSHNAGGQKLVFRQQILQGGRALGSVTRRGNILTTKGPGSIFALIRDNVDELDRLARTCLCVSQGLEFDRGKSCWCASPKNDPDLYYHLQSLKSTTSFQKILMMLMMMLMTRMMRKKLTNSGDAD